MGTPLATTENLDLASCHCSVLLEYQRQVERLEAHTPWTTINNFLVEVAQWAAIGLYPLLIQGFQWAWNKWVALPQGEMQPLNQNAWYNPRRNRRWGLGGVNHQEYRQAPVELAGLGL